MHFQKNKNNKYMIIIANNDLLFYLKKKKNIGNGANDLLFDWLK